MGRRSTITIRCGVQVRTCGLLTSTAMFNATGHSDTFFSTPTIPLTDAEIKSLTLSDVMKNPHVQLIYNNWNTAASQVMKSSEMHDKLWQERCRLQAELESLKQNIRYDLHSCFYSINQFFFSLKLPNAVKSLGASIAPSDSISYHIGIQDVSTYQPATRPSQYPPEILWNLEDCKSDPDVAVSQTNPSRPSMEKAIRHADGTLITDAEWAAIKATARMVKSELAALKRPSARNVKKIKRTKMYYRSYHSSEWFAALEKMERHQPLLALCASHWKAEHVLGNTLLHGHDVNPNDSEIDTCSDSSKACNKKESVAQGKKRRLRDAPRKGKRVKGPSHHEDQSDGDTGNVYAP